MVVLRRSAGSRRRSLAAMDSSSEFLSLQPGGRRTSRQRAAPADYSSTSIECFNGHRLRSMRKSILRCSVSSFEESMAILRGTVNRRRFSSYQYCCLSWNRFSTKENSVVSRNPERTVYGQLEDDESTVWINDAMLYPDLDAITDLKGNLATVAVHGAEVFHRGI